MFTTDIGIDLGTASVLVYIKGRGIVLEEPSVVAINNKTNQVLAVGEEASAMLGRTPGNIAAIRPLEQGVISDFDRTEQMLDYFIKKAVGKTMFLRPRISICVPSTVTEMEKRAVEAVAKRAGARHGHIIEETIAAAIGAGLDIGKACGSMIVDIGGGTTDIAIISLGSTVVSNSLKVAGNHMDDAIIRYMRKEHKLLVGERTAEEIKINIGTAYPREERVYMDVRGRNLVSGLPKTVTVNSDEMLYALEEPVSSIVEAVHNVLELAPPELAADIANRGIVMTGGSSMLYGLDQLLNEYAGIQTIIAEDPISCVAIGTGKYVEAMSKQARKRRR